jgi:hypothetical protein
MVGHMFATTIRVMVTAACAAVALSVTASDAHAAPKRPEPVLTVVDNTNGQWSGVRAAVRTWGAMPWVRMRPARTCDDAPGYCVVLDAYDHKDSGWMGLTTPLTARVAHIQLNTSGDYAARFGTDQPALRQAIVCHELAHALGIQHPLPTQGKRGCMANSDHAHTAPGPTAADRRLFRAAAREPWFSPFGMMQWEWMQGRVYAGPSRNQ